MEFKKEVRKETYAVKITVEESGKIVAWAYLYVIVNDRHKEPYGLLENVYVEEGYRKQGLGTQLVRKVIEEAQARGCYKLIGTSRHIRPEVHDFYEKLGFKNWGIEFRLDLPSPQKDK